MVEKLVDILEKYETVLSVETVSFKKVKIVLTKDGKNYTRVFALEDLKLPLDETIAYFVKEVNGDINPKTDILRLLKMYNLSMTIRQEYDDYIILRIFDDYRSYRCVISRNSIDVSTEDAVAECIKNTIEIIRKETECV